jgi:hypothetical protein
MVEAEQTEDAPSDRASNLRSAATSLHCHQADACLTDHFSSSPLVGSKGSAAPALIPPIRAGRVVHEFTWSDSHGAEPSSGIGRGGFDYHGRVCLPP